MPLPTRAQRKRCNDPYFWILHRASALVDALLSLRGIRINHSCRNSAWSARRSSLDTRFHSFLSTVDQRLHVKQPFRRSPRLSISISGCLHWLQQVILSASMTARSAFLRALTSVSPYRQLACARFCHSATFSAPVFQSSSMVAKHFSQSATSISVVPGSARAYLPPGRLRISRIYLNLSLSRCLRVPLVAMSEATQ